jgi:hypothetical protein
MSAASPICPSCARATRSRLRCRRCGGLLRIRDYAVQAPLVVRAYRRTYLAEGQGQRVVIHELCWAKVPDVEAVDRFEAGYRRTMGLAGEGLPSPVEAFSEGKGRARRLYRVHRAVEGQPLGARGRPSAKELARVLRGALVLLEALHAQGVVHGAVVAEHLVTGEGGRVGLVGFGAGGDGCEEELPPSVDLTALARVLAEHVPLLEEGAALSRYLPVLATARSAPAALAALGSLGADVDASPAAPLEEGIAASRSAGDGLLNSGIQWLAGARVRGAECGAPAWIVRAGGKCFGLRPGHAYRVGRSSECEVRISDDWIGGDTSSRLHAVLLVTGEGLWISDLQSTNGTFVHGTRLNARAAGARLEGPAEVRLGQLPFRVWPLEDDAGQQAKW